MMQFMNTLLHLRR